jgi:hypothetical protein
MVEYVTTRSLSNATDEAARLWAFSCAHYPKSHKILLDHATRDIIDVVSSFALNARRSMEILPATRSFTLNQPRWHWEPGHHGELLTDFRQACNRIIHARQLFVGFEDLRDSDAFIKDGTVIVPYVRAATDRFDLVFIDPFAMAYSFLYEVLPVLLELKTTVEKEGVGG